MSIFSQKKFIILLVALIFTVFCFYLLFLSAPSGFPKGVILNIEEGTTLRYLSGDLKAEKIIRSRIAFEAFVIMYGGEKHLILGDYLFEKKTPVFEVARRISKGVYHLAPVKITIPEGFDISQISESFVGKLHDFNKENFIVEARLREGYLFPDTYFFLTTANEKDVLKSMGDNYKKKILPFLEKIVATGKTEGQVITMASIIEREAKGDADRTVISGILWSRIKKGMPLQVDAAPDTYKTKGLPKSPICNPGIKAIEASIYPENSPYLYYLHDKEGAIHYARTFEEHKINKLKYLR
ncbi:endolytic transglycosylase MltG [Patescibacteria group bacterium]|nr:endolytic transglycosylase MltG [Patescibacteria group bacterium]MBU1728261.1 endolytic transglycosylase MltG [Patescibacteria group bacterium]